MLNNSLWKNKPDKNKLIFNKNIKIHVFEILKNQKLCWSVLGKENNII